MSSPARLAKKKTTSEKMEDYVLSHAHIILPLAIIILLLLIGAVIGVVISGGNITVVESGNYYNHFKDVI